MFWTKSSCKAKYCLSALLTAIGTISGVLVLSSENVKNITIDDEIVNVELLLKYPATNYHEELKGLG